MEVNKYKDLPLLDDDQMEMLISTGDSMAADLIEELLGLYTDESGKLVQSVSQANVESDPKIVSREAHAIAGSSANLGVLRISKITKALELSIVSDGFTSEVLALCAGLPAVYEESVKAVKAQIAEIRNA